MAQLKGMAPRNMPSAKLSHKPEGNVPKRPTEESQTELNLRLLGEVQYELKKVSPSHGDLFDYITDLAIVDLKNFAAMARIRLLLKKGADVNAKDGNRRTPLMHAAQGGHDALCRLLIKKGADIDARDDGNETALMKAAMCGHSKICALLIRSGASMGFVNSLGNSALKLAMLNNRSKVVKVMLKAVFGNKIGSALLYNLKKCISL
jgi:ankyrin repeat protein